MHMKFIVDHKNKLIHKVVCAGDRCGFKDTPLSEREFTKSLTYLENLQQQKDYHLCASCKAAAIGPLYVKKNR